MSKRKHTEGPWSSGNEYIGVGGTISGYIVHAGKEKEYAVGLVLGGSECEETEANAHLISSAPCLLAACEEGPGRFNSLAAYLRSTALRCDDDEFREMLYVKAEQIEAAIAKATGGQQ